MKLVRKVSAWLLAVVIVAGAGFYAWASFAANRFLSRTVHCTDGPAHVHLAHFPVE